MNNLLAIQRGGETWPAEGSKVKVNSWVEAATKNPLVAVMKETIIRYNGNPSRAILCSFVWFSIVLSGFYWVLDGVTPDSLTATK